MVGGSGESEQGNDVDEVEANAEGNAGEREDGSGADDIDKGVDDEEISRDGGVLEKDGSVSKSGNHQSESNDAENGTADVNSPLHFDVIGVENAHSEETAHYGDALASIDDAIATVLYLHAVSDVDGLIDFYNEDTKEAWANNGYDVTEMVEDLLVTNKEVLMDYIAEYGDLETVNINNARVTEFPDAHHNDTLEEISVSATLMFENGSEEDYYFYFLLENGEWKTHGHASVMHMKRLMQE